MEAFLTTNKGMENIASLEVKDVLGKLSRISEEVIKFKIKGYEDLFNLCYTSQSARKVCLLLHECSNDDIVGEFSKNIGRLHLEKFLEKGDSFRILIEGDSTLVEDISEIEGKIGELVISQIQDKKGYRQKVDLVNPIITFYGYITKDGFYLGIDFAGFDLSKRKYKIYSVPGSTKGTIAYGLVRSSGFDGSGIFLDCFTGSGEVAIEAAMFATRYPLNYFSRERFSFQRYNKFKNFDFEKIFDFIDKKKKDKIGKIIALDSSMKNVSFAKKNSKIAGVDKIIAFSRADIEWLDTKFKKSSVDWIVARFPFQRGKNDSVTGDFMHQSEFILTKNGIMVLVGEEKSIIKNIKNYSFKLIEKKSLYSGKRKYDIFVISKKTNF